MFSILVTHIHFTESLSDEIRDSKLIQTSVERWDPHDLDDENRKLSHITQNSLHPNKLLLIYFDHSLCLHGLCITHSHNFNIYFYFLNKWGLLVKFYI